MTDEDSIHHEGEHLPGPEPKKVVISISVDKKNLERLRNHLEKEHDSTNISRSFNYWLEKFVKWLDKWEAEQNKKKEKPEEQEEKKEGENDKEN